MDSGLVTEGQVVQESVTILLSEKLFQAISYPIYFAYIFFYMCKIHTMIKISLHVKNHLPVIRQHSGMAYFVTIFLRNKITLHLVISGFLDLVRC